MATTTGQPLPPILEKAKPFGRVPPNACSTPISTSHLPKNAHTIQTITATSPLVNPPIIGLQPSMIDKPPPKPTVSYEAKTAI